MRTGLQAVDRAVAILGCFDADRSDLSVAEIASRLGLNRSTTWRYLNSLSQNGMLTALDNTGRYALGPGALQLGNAYTSRWRALSDVATSYLTQLRDLTGETAALHVRHAWSRVVVTQVESRQELHRTYRDIGQPIPMHLGAPSLAILAFLTKQEQRSYYATQHADIPGDVERALDGLAEIKRQGYAVSKRARTSDIASVAAPILDAAGAAIAAINVTGPADRFTDSSIREFASQVREAANSITQHLKTRRQPNQGRQAGDYTRGDTPIVEQSIEP